VRKAAAKIRTPSHQGQQTATMSRDSGISSLTNTLASSTTSHPSTPHPFTQVKQEEVKEKEKLVLRNRAGESRSPYVRAHKDNAVKWQIWGDEAVELARRENRLLFVSVGYSACHCEFPLSRIF
jgi:hypothetical protein